MENQRSENRISIASFRDFSVQWEIDGITHVGFLLNLSSRGLCILSKEEPLPEELGEFVSGTLFWKQNKKQTFFEGLFIWSKEEGPSFPGYYRLGIHFSKKLDWNSELLQVLLEF